MYERGPPWLYYCGVAMTVPWHIEREELIDLLQGRLGLGAWDRASRHLTTGCAECFADSAFLLRVTHAPRPVTHSLVTASVQPTPKGRQGLALRAIPPQWVGRAYEGMTERVM